MDFRFSPDEQSFRMEVRKFVKEEILDELKGAAEIHPEHVKAEMACIKKMAEKGWLGASYPKELGGRGEENVPMHEYILLDELHNGDAPGIALTITYLITVIGNTLLSIGSEALKQEFIPRIVDADIRLAICYSEPDAGNDIANIHTRAEVDGDDYIVNGTKRFITCADTSDYMWTLVRTEKGSKRHKGLTIILIKTDSPGITIQPVTMMNGVQTCEVIFEDVRTPRYLLVGKEGAGWRYLMEALARERFTMINFKGVSAPFDKFVQWVRETEIDGKKMADDPVIRQALANFQLKLAGGKMMQLIAGSRAMNKDYIPTIEAAASKMWRAMLSWERANLAIDIMGSYGLMTEESPEAPLGGWWESEYGWAGHELSGAGGKDLNRKIIAQQGLGLPRWSN